MKGGNVRKHVGFSFWDNCATIRSESVFVIFHYFSIFLKQHYVFSMPDYKSEPILGTHTNNYTETLISIFSISRKNSFFLWNTPLHTIYCWAAHFWVKFFFSNSNWKFFLQHAELSSFFSSLTFMMCWLDTPKLK